MNVFIGNKLKKLRKSKNLSQEEMADFLHISQSAYARMENGESHSWANHILNICQIFAITPEELVKRDYLDENAKKQQLMPSYTVQELSDKIIEQYEERIKELKQTIQDLKEYKKV
ncbi:helix-turn-helix transcriptional regulator [Flavobacterium sp. MC2016-06]|jgi:transcriptional regulator with XRE-family HTH domain|uniref:helix-turn-helix domain-containing protein n=1 Tax=Flavobacterium sp. MC2016-06 TaxID=2676308 RepID=UPI0012BA9639|nr:helix-turn-helix transcriptional regulator [Flavobacterium sp. MC2016-06]MBU3861050.1 helix-turn-helix domain-containing protein [Flavobacterium sp. MC2016-06]